ncbi:MAG: metallophosphoesterase, partial [Candidatus Omnitrophota bacterium]
LYKRLGLAILIGGPLITFITGLIYILLQPSYIAGTWSVLIKLWLSQPLPMFIIGFAVGLGIALIYEAKKVKPAVTAKDKISLDAIFDQGGLDELSREYFKTLYHRYQNFDQKPLIIDTGDNGGNFLPSALLTEQQRQELLGVKDYTQVRAEIEKDTQRPDYELQLNSLDGGLGTNVGRGAYIKEKFGRDPKDLGAKGTDLSFEGVISVGGKDYLISVAEVKLLRLIKEVKEGQYGRRVTFEPILSNDEGNASKPSYDALLGKPYLPDLLGNRSEVRTYAQVLKELGVILSERIAGVYPSLDIDTKQPTYKRPGNGSHGEWGFKLLSESLESKHNSDTQRVIGFYNGDGTNNFPDRYIIEWILKHNVPLVMISTTKTGIDYKGGQIGVERLSDGRYRIRMLEHGSTLDGKKPTGQTKIFEQMGLAGGKGEVNKQYFNCNILGINDGLVARLLKDLLQEVFEGDLAKLQAIIAPDLIPSVKKGPDRKDYIQLEGPVGTCLINLHNYFVLNKDNPKVKAIIERHHIEDGKILRIINVDAKDRTNFFTPIKFATDHWLQAYSDYYRLNTDTWMLEDTQAGRTPPLFELEDSYYKDVSNVYEAFGQARVTGLKSLTIKGKPVKLTDAVLEGEVEIENRTQEKVDLNSLFEDKSNYQFTVSQGQFSKNQDGRLELKNAKLVINFQEPRSVASQRKSGEPSSLNRVARGFVPNASPRTRTPETTKEDPADYWQKIIGQKVYGENGEDTNDKLPRVKQPRLIAQGDIHGELDKFQDNLRQARLIDNENDWIGGKAILVQVGDTIDRGSKSRETYEFLADLQKQARLAGGEVVRLLGNHELMVLQGYYQFTNFDQPEKLAGQIRRDILSGDVKAAFVFGDRIFTHGDFEFSTIQRRLVEEIAGEKSISPNAVTLSELAEKMNQFLIAAVKIGDFSHEIFGANGIFWSRNNYKYFKNLPGSRLSWAAKQIVGHTPGGKVRYTDSLGLINVDAGLCGNLGGNQAFLEIDDNKIKIIAKDFNGDWSEKELGDFIEGSSVFVASQHQKSRSSSLSLPKVSLSAGSFLAAGAFANFFTINVFWIIGILF